MKCKDKNIIKMRAPTNFKTVTNPAYEYQELRS
jgi:hypothetical protein